MPKKLEGVRKVYVMQRIRDPRDRRQPRLDSSADEPDAPVRAPLKPKPNLRSGAVALPEPEPEE